MTARTAKIFVATGVLLLLAAGVSAWRERPDPQAICTRAADQYVACVEELFGAEGPMAQKVRSQRDEGIPACVDDPMTVAMYQTCTKEADCEAFMQCLMDFVVRE